MKRALRDGAVPRTTVRLGELLRVRTVRDLPYADQSPRNVLDVYHPVPMPSEPAPVLVLVHGGGWDHGDKKQCAPYAVHFAARGMLCVSINYRLSDTATHPAALEDFVSALLWVAANARTYGGDSNRVALVGFSAGAHLCMLAAYASPSARAIPGLTVRCVVDVYGPVDLVSADARKMSAVRRLLGAKYRHSPARYIEASPISHVDATDPPTLVLHGSVDDIVPVTHAERLVSALRAAGVPCRFERVNGWGHAMDRAQPMFDRCSAAMAEFFNQHLISPPRT